MNWFSIFMVILSIIFLLCSTVPGKEQFVPLTCYMLLLAVLVEVDCIHDTLRRK